MAKTGKTEITFKGDESLEKILEKLPLKVSRKPVIKALKKGANPVKRAIKQSAPVDSGEMKKAVGVKAGKSKEYPNIKVGFKTGGGNMPHWSKAYWQNYGTLENRAPGHEFKESRKQKTRHWKGGIEPKFFVENAWESTQDNAQKLIEDNFETEIVKFLKKNAVK